MRICILYDCLFPHTVGGAERWYRSLAGRLAADGHDVTYLTLRQWEEPAGPDAPDGVKVVAVGPRMRLYTTSGRRRIGPPIVFGLGVLWHLLRHGRRYEVVHTASFPYFSLLAAGAVRALGGYRLVVDWHEVWSREYWREYLGPIAGALGYGVQLQCVRLRQRAFCFSRLHAGRLSDEGLRGEPTVLEGEYAGPLETPEVSPAEPLVVIAGRLIPEKRAPLAVAAFAAAARQIEGLQGELYGDGPDRDAVLAAIVEHKLTGRLIAPGFVDAATVDRALRRATCMLSTSRREGYGMVVVEASARGTPSIVVAGEDNAAVELVEDGVNGLIVDDPDPAAIAAEIVNIFRMGMAMRESTARWFSENAERISLESSLRTVLESYAQSAAGPVHQPVTTMPR